MLNYLFFANHNNDESHNFLWQRKRDVEEMEYIRFSTERIDTDVNLN